MNPLAVALAFVAAQPPTPPTDSVTLRIATFNVEDVRTKDLLDAANPRLRAIAETIQRIRPNIILLNEIACDDTGAMDVPAGQPALQNGDRFAGTFLAVSQAPDVQPIRMRAFMAPVNTGVPSGFDLDNDGEVKTTLPEPSAGGHDMPADARRYGNDCLGFGTFPGQYGMALLVDERLEILRDRVRTFRLLPWDYVTGNMMPTDSTTNAPWFNDEERAIVRLSSKSHWDVPVRLPGGLILHLLCSHPTPPAFDGPEQRNRRRNHDEIRFWADYVNQAPYIVDDSNTPGGIAEGEPFVILGDLNADPDEGSSLKGPIEMLIRAASLATYPAPASQIPVTGLDPDDTARFKLRVDYVLPCGWIEVVGSGVWRTEPSARARPSDHFPVWIDAKIPVRQ